MQHIYGYCVGVWAISYNRTQNCQWNIAAKLLNSMPSTYDTVYVVCDRYGEASIKSVECQTCGYGEKCIF